jgi:hypothetical protein
LPTEQTRSVVEPEAGEHPGAAAIETVVEKLSVTTTWESVLDPLFVNVAIASAGCPP